MREISVEKKVRLPYAPGTRQVGQENDRQWIN